MFRVDLNCDVGESFGPYQLGGDEEIIPLVTSANIACGFHAGDPATMGRTVRLAMQHGVAIGAHPGLPDLAGFGRRQMAISPQEAYELVIYQVGALYGFARAEGALLQHVKPHGALYNMAARDRGLAEAIAEAVYRVDPELILFGLAGGELVKAGERMGLRTASEAFADRTYQPDGSLTPRNDPRALITDGEQAARQALMMIKEGRVFTLGGTEVPIRADTLCLHGDGVTAPALARVIRRELLAAGVSIQPVSRFK